MKITFERRLIVFFLAVIAGIIVIGAVAYRTNRTFHDNETMIKHTQEVLFQSEQIFSTTKDFESGSRGYVITSDSNYLSNYSRAKDTIFYHIQRIKQLTRGNNVQQARIDTLIELTYQGIGFSEKSIQLKNSKGF